MESTSSRGVSIQKKVSSSLESKLKDLPPASSSWCCIYKVPKKLREIKEAAYTPRLVSIGPIHHCQTHLQAMERHKLRYLQSYLELIGEKSETLAKKLESLADRAKKWEGVFRDHYQDTSELSSEKYIEMLVLDGVFILVLFLRNKFPKMRDTTDVIFTNQWIKKELLHDMMLLENQLPFYFTWELLNYIVDKLSKLLEPSEPPKSVTFYELANEYFKYVGNVNSISTTNGESPLYKGRHLVEYLRILHLPSDHDNLTRYRGKFEYTRSATELQEAGVKFVQATGESCIFKIKFDHANGVLTIPQLMVNEWTETFFKNLIAFEQCDHQFGTISSYVILMDSLINTAKDVDLLIQCKIIDNSLSDSEQVADLFNNLYKETVTEDTTFYYTDMCNELNEYSKNYWHQWKAAWYNAKVVLKRDYFGNPWSIISVWAAAVLLGLTVTQTIYAVLSYKKSE